MRSERIPVGVLAFFLWAATTALGLWEIYILQEMALRTYARFGEGYWVGIVLRDCAVFILGIVWIAMAVGGGEYHFKHVGQRNSWQLFGWIIALEVAILVLALFV